MQKRKLGRTGIEIAPIVFSANPHLDPERDRAAVSRYAVLLARIERVYDWLSAQTDAVFPSAARSPNA